MKKLYFDTLILALLLMVGLPAEMRAQLTYSSVETVAAATDKSHDSETGCVYLYNVGAEEYLSAGGTWGTQPMTHEVGMALYINTGSGDYLSSPSTGTYYQIGTNIYANSIDGYLGYVRTNLSNYDTGLFMDRDGISTNSYDGVVRMIFTQVSSDDYGPIYTISFVDYPNYTHDSSGDWVDDVTTSTSSTTYYLVAQEGDNMAINAVASGSVDTSDGLARWRLVTRGDFIDNFTDLHNGTTKGNATFLITDQNFNRNNKNQDAWEYTDETTLTIGCGTSDDHQTYGAYWLAYMTDEGEVYQTIKSVAAGWYQLLVKGFSTGSSAAQAFIRVLDGVVETTDQTTGEITISLTNATVASSRTADLHIFSNSTFDVTDADDIMALDEELISSSSTYQTETYVMIYIPEDTYFQIGVTADENSGYTLFDDVQLYYCGEKDAIVLDESWEDNDTDNGLKKIQWQKSDYSKTLLLKRTLVQGKWNSLILPVNVTVEGMRSAFGGDTDLCQLSSVSEDGADIYFESVIYDTDSGDESGKTEILGESDIAIQAGKMYIIKPSDLNPIAEDEANDYDYEIVEPTENEDALPTSLTGTLKAPYYSIALATFTEEVTSATVTDENVVGSNFESPRDGKIYMMGTYVNGTTVPDKSYVINANDGNWYYLNMGGTTNITSQGFRAWISTKSTSSTSEETSMASVATLHIDDESITDGIDGLAEELGFETAGSVYSLSGQKVSSGSLSGLSKGIYIKNGKKYIVK